MRFTLTHACDTDDVIRYDSTVLYAKNLVDMVTPLLPVSQLGRTTITNGAAHSKVVKLSPYSVVTISVAGAGIDVIN